MPLMGCLSAGIASHSLPVLKPSKNIFRADARYFLAKRHRQLSVRRRDLLPPLRKRDPRGVGRLRVSPPASRLLAMLLSQLRYRLLPLPFQPP